MWSEIETHWQLLQPRVRRHWFRLSQGDVEAVDGKRDILIRRLQDRYGFSPQQADREVEAWAWLVTAAHAA